MIEPATPRIVARDGWERAAERDLHYAVSSGGPWNEIVAYRDFMRDQAGSWWRRDRRTIAQWTRTNAAVT